MSDATSSTIGFPHPTEGVPDGLAHPLAALLPVAEQRLDHFLTCLNRANAKLAARSARLPDGLGLWWIRRWTDEVLFHSSMAPVQLDDVQALYRLARRLDQLVFISGSSPESPCPRDVEFTYHAEPILWANPPKPPARQPLSQLDLSAHSRGLATPIDFPGLNSGSPHTELSPRISCEAFLHWAAFLTSPDPLTPEQWEHLEHVSYSEVGEDKWCLVNGTHEQVFGSLVRRILNRIRDMITRLSDSHGLAIESIPRSGRLDDALQPVSVWLARAKTSRLSPNAMGTEQSPQLARFQNLELETFSPFTWLLDPRSEGRDCD